MKTISENVSLIKQPSAYLPLVMAFAALTLVLLHAVIFGVVHKADESAAAQIFQILIVAYFVVKWLPRQTRESLKILGLLACEWIAAFAAVFWLT